MQLWNCTKSNIKKRLAACITSALAAKYLPQTQLQLQGQAKGCKVCTCDNHLCTHRCAVNGMDACMKCSLFIPCSTHAKLQSTHHADRPGVRGDRWRAQLGGNYHYHETCLASSLFYPDPTAKLPALPKLQRQGRQRERVHVLANQRGDEKREKRVLVLHRPLPAAGRQTQATACLR